MVVFHGFINSMSTKWLAKLTTTYIVFHMLALVTCSIALLVCCPDRHDATYVFTNVTPDSGWTPVGFSFLFGFLSVSWTMTDYDATAHIAEEIDEPEKKAPWAIFLAMGLTYVVGWLFTIVLAFTMGDPITLLENELEQPVIQLFYNNLGKTGAIVFAVCAFIILNSCCIAALQSLSRTVFAYSRDRLIPGSRYLKIVNKSTGTPIIAVWWSVFWCAAINLIALGSYEAIEAIFNVTAIAMDWSYCIPIFCKIFFGKFQPGPWYMGKWGVVVNAYACIWTAFVSIIFLFPNFQPVTVDTMNWASMLYLSLFLSDLCIHETNESQLSCLLASLSCRPSGGTSAAARTTSVPFPRRILSRVSSLSRRRSSTRSHVSHDCFFPRIQPRRFFIFSFPQFTFHFLLLRPLC